MDVNYNAAVLRAEDACRAVRAPPAGRQCCYAACSSPWTRLMSVDKARLFNSKTPTTSIYGGGDGNRR